MNIVYVVCHVHPNQDGSQSLVLIEGQLECTRSNMFVDAVTKHMHKTYRQSEM